MHFSHFLFTTLVTAQVYYMYKFIYSIPLKYEIPETENDYVEIGTLLRGMREINDSSHGMHKRKHQQRQHLEQTRNDNNTALTYMHVTTLDVVGRF